MALKEMTGEAQELVAQISSKLAEIAANLPVEAPVDGEPTPVVGFTQEEVDAKVSEAVASFKADLKTKYAEQQVAESTGETGFSDLLN